MNYRKHIFLFSFCFILFGCTTVQKKLTKELKIVSLSPSVTEIIGTFGKPETLKGRTGSCNYPKWVQKVSPVISLKPNYELLLSMHPDLIIYDPTLFSAIDIAKLKEINSLLLPISARSLNDFINSLIKLDETTKKQLNLSAYIEKIKQTVAKPQKKTFNHPLKVAILLDSEDQKQYWIAGKKTFQADILSQLGVKVIGPNIDRFEKLNLEYLVSQNPDIIFTKNKVENFLRDPRLRMINAIKNKTIYRIESDILLRAGARVDQLIQNFKECLERFSL